VCLLSTPWATTHRLRVTKTIYDEHGGSRQESKIIEINVEPGYRAGQRVTFPEAGDVIPGETPGDLVFVLEEKPHEYYKREGDDLVFTAKISLVQALTGIKITLPTLDGKSENVVIKDFVIDPNYVHRISGRGMPVHHRGTYGDLLIKFDLQFPKRIGAEEKKELKNIFARIH